MAKNIENTLEKFHTEMEKHWQSGAMEKGLIKSNPMLQQKYILNPRSDLYLGVQHNSMYPGESPERGRPLETPIKALKMNSETVILHS